MIPSEPLRALLSATKRDVAVRLLSRYPPEAIDFRTLNFMRARVEISVELCFSSVAWLLGYCVVVVTGASLSGVESPLLSCPAQHRRPAFS